MNGKILALNSWLLVFSAVCLVTGESEQQVCTSSPCSTSEAYDGEQADSTLSLVQMESRALRSMTARMKPSRHDVAGGGQGRDGVDEESASVREQRFVQHEEYAFKQHRALRHAFPLQTSTPDDVAEFWNVFGEAAVGTRMKSENIDGRVFYDMDKEDFDRLGVSERDRRTIVDRIEIGRAQDETRQAMMRMARSKKPFAGISTMHDIVGPDGVLMITLDRMPERFNQSAQALMQVGVQPTKISAVDVTTASPEELKRGCQKLGDPGVKEWCHKNGLREDGKAGFGCAYPTEQAVAAAHRKALERAKERGGEWTAILEDDSVPAPVENWNVALREMWNKIPERTKFVRLGWCQISTMDWRDPIVQVAYANGTGATLVAKEGCCGTSFYDPGGCTTAYMVHRDILDDLLKLFPCCGPIDSCLKWDYFKVYDPKEKEDHGVTVMMSIDSHTKPLWDGNIEHHGLILQDRATIGSAQEIPWGTFDIIGR
mmetsp:Transcript_161383/g.310048  ORF Transcript_161383/g.310048 Transcript_161383/m.310048 type:complete len:486 (-) Transcript_161383:66-1523(-)